MGSVYAAQDERLGRIVALKVLRADLATDPKARDRFLREAQIAAQLVHPHIVRTYDVGDASEGPFLVQELLDGRTLDSVIPLPPEQAIAVARAVAEALAYIHGQGYVHCDIKPQNIMLLGDPSSLRVVLLDFGIARIAGTDTTTLIATPQYLAPERMLGTPPTPASDLYALGIVLYETIAGRPPFDAPTMHGILEQHRTAPIPPLQPGIPHSATLDHMINKLAAKQPSDRYPSASAALRDIEAVQPGSPHAQPTVVVARPQAAAQKLSTPPVQPQAIVGRSNHKRIGLRFLVLPLLFGALLLGAFITRPRTNATGNAIVPASAPAAVVPTTPTAVKVPAVIGVPIAEAQRQLEAAGLTVVIGQAIASDQPADTVATISPSPDLLVPPNTPVTIQPSLGPTPPVAQPAPVPPAADDDKEDKGKDADKEKDKDKGRGKNKDN